MGVTYRNDGTTEHEYETCTCCGGDYTNCDRCSQIEPERVGWNENRVILGESGGWMIPVVIGGAAFLAAILLIVMEMLR
jgi:hypothetical protein